MMRLVRLPVLLSFVSLGAAGLYIAESVPTSNEALAGDYQSLIQTDTHGRPEGKRTVTEKSVLANQLRQFLETGGTQPAGPQVKVAQAEINIVTSNKSDRADIIEPAGAKPDSQADDDDELADEETADLTEGELLDEDAELDDEDTELDEVELAADDSLEGELDEEELDEAELDDEAA